MAQQPGWRTRFVNMARQRCHRCLRGRVFRSGMHMFYACPECRLVFGRENGYFTGAMIVSYMLAAQLLGGLAVIVWLASGWRVEWVLLAAGMLFLAFVPPLFRYSRVVWMH